MKKKIIMLIISISAIFLLINNNEEKIYIISEFNCLALDKIEDCTKLGLYFSTKENPNYQKAINYYNIGIKHNDRNSQNNLGSLYQRGEGIEKDLKKAKELFNLSANQGNHLAQYNLGLMYKNGDGVKKDIYEAIKWFNLSANQGNVLSQNNLGVIYSQDNFKNYKEAAILFEKASNQNYVLAKINLANLYYEGNGVEKNVKKAVAILNKEAKLGNMIAISNLETICKTNMKECLEEKIF